MKFATTLLFAAAAAALDVVTDGSKPFGIMSLRSASAVHLSTVGLSGDSLHIGGNSDTSFTIKDGVLYAGDKAIDFSSGVAKVAEDGKGTTGVTLSKGYVTVPDFSWAGCPADSGFTVETNSKCETDGVPFGAYAIAAAGSSEEPKSSEAAAAPSSEAAAATTEAPAATTPLTSAAKPTAGPVVSQIGDGQVQAPPSAPPAAPEQANGAASFGVSAAALGVAAAALLI